MKIMLNRNIKREPWGGGSHFITALFEYLTAKGHNVVFSLEDNIDIIFMFDPRPSAGGDCVNSIYQYKLFKPSTKVVQRINDTDIARPKDRPWRIDLLLQANKIADHTIFISNWVKNHYIEKGFVKEKPNTVIINGCNSEWYYPEEKELDKKKIKLITHHWSDNFAKGFEIYNFLDKFVESNRNIEFTYMGRYNSDYSPKNTTIIPPTYGPDVGKILRSQDIYVTAAKWEACGMHHIEGARCGLPVLYHVDGGAIPEVCKNYGLGFSSTVEFEHRLSDLISNIDSYRANINYDFLSIERCCSEYERVISGLIS